MWITTVVLFTFYGVISGAPDICKKGRPDICFTHPVEPLDFPDSIEAMDKICPIITTRLRCLVDYKNKCGAEFPGSIDENMEQILELITDICDKDSELHQGLSVRLPCIERIVMSHRNSCQPIIDDAMEAVRSRILGSVDDDTTEGPEDWRKYYCLSEALDYACLVADASVTCGHATKELVERIVERVGFLDSICEADVREEVKEIVSIMQAEMEEGLTIKNIISKD